MAQSGIELNDGLRTDSFPLRVPNQLSIEYSRYDGIQILMSGPGVEFGDQGVPSLFGWLWFLWFVIFASVLDQFRSVSINFRIFDAYIRSLYHIDASRVDQFVY
jgi:hypothetical protein